MLPPLIRPFEPTDRDAVITLIVGIQQDEFAIPITAEEQPDLSAIPAFYQTGGGGFWVAEVAGALVGTIGLKAFGGGEAALRKMFVAPEGRGSGAGVAAALLASLIDHARAGGITDIFLGTIERLQAAIRFYEKNGFTLIPAEDLPATYPRMAVDTHFYHLRLD